MSDVQMRLYWILVDPDPMTGVLTRGKFGWSRHTGRHSVTTGQREEKRIYEPRNAKDAGNQQQLEEARDDLS